MGSFLFKILFYVFKNYGKIKKRQIFSRLFWRDGFRFVVLSAVFIF